MGVPVWAGFPGPFLSQVLPLLALLANPIHTHLCPQWGTHPAVARSISSIPALLWDVIALPQKYNAFAVIWFW